MRFDRWKAWMEAARHPWPALGTLLVRDGLVPEDELKGILAEQYEARNQRVSGRRLGEILIQRGFITSVDIARLVAEQYELPFLDLDSENVDPEAAAALTEEDARRLSAIPIERGDDGTLVLAIADPATVLFSDELRRLLGSVPRFAVVGPDAIERAFAALYETPEQETVPEQVDEPSQPDPPPARPQVVSARPLLGELLMREGDLTEVELDAALAQQRLSPELRLGEILVGRGVVSTSAVARLVAEQYELPYADLTPEAVDPAVARRLSEEIARRLPAVPVRSSEDGSVTVAIADPTDAFTTDELQRALGVPLTFIVAPADAIHALVRYAHAPEAHAAARLAAVPRTARSAAGDTGPEPTALDELGLSEDAEHALRDALESTSGSILVCGPARSGRTTTVRALLAAAAGLGRTCMAVTNTAAQASDVIDQVRLDDVTLDSALRGVRHAGRDVVAVDGLPGRDIAAFVLESAFAGELVVATLHAPSASSAVRLVTSSGGGADLHASVLRCVVSQRLVRRLCADCAEPYYATTEELAALGKSKRGSPRLLAHGKGCDACAGTGLDGWTGVFEVMPVTSAVRDAVNEAATADRIQGVAVSEGMKTLRDQAARLCLEGVTTVAEVAPILELPI